MIKTLDVDVFRYYHRDDICVSGPVRGYHPPSTPYCLLDMFDWCLTPTLAVFYI